MDKGANSSLFVNDGSFMERFKKFQEGKRRKEAAAGESDQRITSRSEPPVSRKVRESKANEAQKITPSFSSGKLAFSLKQKSKLTVAPVKLSADEDEDEGDQDSGHVDGHSKRQKLVLSDACKPSSEQGDVAPPPPTDPAVKKVADKLASFVVKNGRQFEHITRQRNPGDTPFKFLFDTNCADYRYYEYRVNEEEKILAQTRDSQASHNGASVSNCRPVDASQKSMARQHSSYQIPASALYESGNDGRCSITSTASESGELNGSPAASDPIAMMEFYMKKAAQEERLRQPKQSKDEMPPPPSLQAPAKRGHHMGDYIPPEELERFLASCNDAAAQRASKEVTEKAKIQADNVGHKLLSKMGWKEGEGLGSSKSGRADPVFAGTVKLNNLGVGAEHPGEVTPEDDIYEQYKKRMMLGYRYRPNPLNNPRKAYY